MRRPDPPRRVEFTLLPVLLHLENGRQPATKISEAFSRSPHPPAGWTGWLGGLLIVTQERETRSKPGTPTGGRSIARLERRRTPVDAANHEPSLLPDGAMSHTNSVGRLCRKNEKNPRDRQGELFHNEATRQRGRACRVRGERSFVPGISLVKPRLARYPGRGSPSRRASPNDFIAIASRNQAAMGRGGRIDRLASARR